MARTLVRQIKDARRNYLINGAMEMAQRGTSFVAAASGQYVVDRWQYSKVGAMVHTVTQDTDVPSVAQVLAATGQEYVFNNSLRLNLTTPDTSLGPTEYCEVWQWVEGYNWRDLARKPFTLSFWVKATLAGTYCVTAASSTQDMCYVNEYTINTANTWEYKTVTYSASPAAGTWNYTNGGGVQISFSLAGGSNFVTTPGSWQAVNVNTTANQVNGVNTGATDFRLTGVMLNAGSTAAPFSLFGSSADGEVAACQRYFAKTFPRNVAVVDNGGIAGTINGTANGTSANNAVSLVWRFPVTMRTTPNIATYNPSAGTAGYLFNVSNTTSLQSAIGSAYTSDSATVILNAATAINEAYYAVHVTADAEL